LFWVVGALESTIWQFISARGNIFNHLPSNAIAKEANYASEEQLATIRAKKGFIIDMVTFYDSKII